MLVSVSTSVLELGPFRVTEVGTVKDKAADAVPLIVNWAAEAAGALRIE